MIKMAEKRILLRLNNVYKVYGSNENNEGGEDLKSSRRLSYWPDEENIKAVYQGLRNTNQTPKGGMINGISPHNFKFMTPSINNMEYQSKRYDNKHNVKTAQTSWNSSKERPWIPTAVLPKSQMWKQKYLSQSNANILKANEENSVFQDNDNSSKQSSGLINIATGLPKRSGSQKVRDTVNQHFNKRKDCTAFIESQQQDVSHVMRHRTDQSQNNSVERENLKLSSVPSAQKEAEKKWEVAEIGTESVTFNIKLNDDILSERDKMIKAIKGYIKKNKRLPPTTLDYYKFIKLVGKGAFGKVTLGVHKLTGSEVAIKTIEKSYMKDDFSRKKVLQEVYILKNIKHSNVIRLLEVFESPKHLLIVMEYSGGGDLLKYIKKHGRLSENKAREYFIQIVYGLAHCHWRSVLHRDVKLDNILLDSNGGVKLWDFGVSKIMKKDQVINEQWGTPAYIAPEIISDQGYSGFSVDIWSLGVLLYAMLWGTVPFKASNMKDLHNLIMKGSFSFPWELSSDVKDLIKNMLKLKPEERYSIPEILNSNWVKSREMTHDSLGEIDINTNVSLSRKELNIMNDSGSLNGINNVNIDNLFK